MAGRNYLSPEHSLPNAVKNTIISLEVSILTTHQTSYHQWIQKGCFDVKSLLSTSLLPTKSILNRLSTKKTNKN